MGFIDGKWRQGLHLEPPQGWLNDPNGLCYFKGKYHFYFQYSPDSSTGEGRKCWGHYQSKNLLDWEFTGTVLYPDSEYDKDGVYSGCAVVHDNKMYIFYTGNVKEIGDYDYVTNGRGANVISVTSDDGISMSKKNVLLTNSDYPSFCSCHVRDPKVWFDGGKWHMVLGARTLDNNGGVLFYTSDDLKTWKYSHFLTTENFGYMWECPDVFSLDNKKILSISPQGVKSCETKFQNVYHSGYLQLSEDININSFTEWDYGFDFYAPQTFQTPDKRRILVGWAGIGDIPYNNPTTKLGFQHCLTIPRELAFLENGKISQKPISELKQLRKNSTEFHNNDKISVNLPSEIVGTTETDFTIVIDDGLEISYDGKITKMEFSNEILGGGRTVRKAELENCKNFRVILDKSTIEVYLNDGEIVMTSRFYPAKETVTARIYWGCGKIYELKNMEVSYLGE